MAPCPGPIPNDSVGPLSVVDQTWSIYINQPGIWSLSDMILYDLIQYPIQMMKKFYDTIKYGKISLVIIPKNGQYVILGTYNKGYIIPYCSSLLCTQV